MRYLLPFLLLALLANRLPAYSYVHIDKVDGYVRRIEIIDTVERRTAVVTFMREIDGEVMVYTNVLHLPPVMLGTPQHYGMNTTADRVKRRPSKPSPSVVIRTRSSIRYYR